MMQESQKELLALLAQTLFGEPGDAVLSEEVLEEAQQQTVKSLVTTDYPSLANTIRVHAAHAGLTRDLEGIPFVTIKGYASASYYPDPNRRTMGDVDLYVEEAYYAQASNRLKAAGYLPKTEKHLRHEDFRKDKVDYELHFEIHGIPNGKGGIATSLPRAEERVRAHLADLVETAVREETPFGVVVVPDAFHHGLIMLLHLAGHMLNGGGIGLRHLCDWAVYAHCVDVSAFRSPLEEMGLWVFACQLTALCSRFLGLEPKAWAGEWAEDFLQAFLEDFLEAGNFSRKDKTRRLSLELQRERGFFPSLVKMTREQYPFCAEHPALLPPAMLLFGGRFLWHRLTGKREWLSPRAVRKAEKRKELYQCFQLFEP